MTARPPWSGRLLPAVIGFALLAACGSPDTKNASDDIGKMDDELEARAVEIEQRANDAAAAVEREAQAELERLEREASAAPPPTPEQGDEDSSN